PESATFTSSAASCATRYVGSADESANGSSNASARAGSSSAASGRSTSSRCSVPYRSVTTRASASSSKLRPSNPNEDERGGSEASSPAGAAKRGATVA